MKMRASLEPIVNESLSGRVLLIPGFLNILKNFCRLICALTALTTSIGKRLDR
jgi:hypothetical protein